MVADHDVGAAARQLQRDRAAHVARAAGDEGDAPLSSAHSYGSEESRSQLAGVRSEPASDFERTAGRFRRMNARSGEARSRTSAAARRLHSHGVARPERLRAPGLGDHARTRAGGRAALAYSPSALARALVTRRTRVIGVIVGDVVDPYFGEITRGVEDVAGRAGYLTIVCNADRRPSVEREYLNLLRDYNAEGAVFAGSGLVEREALSESVGLARRQGMHVVALAPGHSSAVV